MNKNTKLGIAIGTVIALVTGSTMFVYADSLTRQLQIGMSGTDVGVLQSFLARDASIYPQALVTNYFGALTRAAVMRYQARNGIASVGRVGPQTLAFINQQMNNLGGNVTSSTVKPITNVTVTNGGSGNANITWTTPNLTRAVVYYSTVPLSTYEGDNFVTISGSTVAQNNFGTANQTVQIPGVLTNTIYYYSIYTTDQNGLVNMTVPATFTIN